MIIESLACKNCQAFFLKKFFFDYCQTPTTTRFIDLMNNFKSMKYLKAISIISFLLINGLGPHGIPNFAGIPLCLYQFVIDIFSSFSNKYEIAWILGLVGISCMASILIIIVSKKYRDRYLLTGALIALFCCEVFLSNIIHYQKIIA